MKIATATLASPRTRRIGSSLLVLSLALSLSACAGMSKRERNMAIGAVAGGVIGSAATGGSTVGTVGGAVAGGAIANELSKKK